MQSNGFGQGLSSIDREKSYIYVKINKHEVPQNLFITANTCIF